MERNKIIDAVRQAKSGEKKKFMQSIDLAVNLKEIDVKKEEGKFEEFLVLPNGRAKPARICAFVGAETKDSAQKFCDLFILSDDFPKWENKRKNRKLARDYDFFIAQANIMPLVAKTFGKFLGTTGKMPNPKAGHIFPPKANIEQLVKNLKSTIRIAIKKAPVIHCSVGSENMDDEKIADNILAVLDRIKSKLPRGEHNIANICIKATMGKAVKVR